VRLPTVRPTSRRAALVVLLAACTTAEPTAEVEASSYRATVRTQVLARGEVRQTLTLGGVAEAEQSAHLLPSAPGKVDQILVTFGQPVTKGQVLARMDTTLQRLQLDQAEHGVALAELQLTSAARELERMRPLASTQALTEQALERLQLGVDMARAQLAQGTASVELLREQLRQTVLTAPFDGVVTGVAAEPGDYVSMMGGLGGPPSLIAVAALDPIRLDVQLPERNLPQAREGMPVVVTSDIFPDQPFSGTLAALNAAAEPGTRTFRARVTVANPDGTLKPGLFLRAALVLDTREDVAWLPPDAITLEGETARVHLVDGEVVRHQPVTVGLRGEDRWEVIGLAEGALVAIEGHHGLPDGAPVRVEP
jgi:membrane fusion protein (multidrug efflux system)